MQTLNNSAEYERNARCIIPIQKRGIIVLASFNQKEIIAVWKLNFQMTLNWDVQNVSDMCLLNHYVRITMKKVIFFSPGVIL